MFLNAQAEQLKPRSLKRQRLITQLQKEGSKDTEKLSGKDKVERARALAGEEGIKVQLANLE
jgi:hypothetical protein